ncbi:PepSY domain-containing protein [Staphylococcus pseudintermedius]
MKFKIISLLLASGIVLAACGNDDDQKNTNNADNDTKTEQTTDNNQNSHDNDRDDNDDQNTNQHTKTQTIDVKDVKTTPEDAIDFKEAVKKAQEQQKGDLKKWSLDNDDGQFVYNIELMTDNGEQELVLDAKSGKVLQQEND